MSSIRQVELKISETAEQEIVVTGFVGSIKNAIIKLVIYNDILSADDAFKLDPPDPNKITIERNITARLVFDPIMARQLAKWLEEQVRIYENVYGKIKAPEGPNRQPNTEMAEIKEEQRIGSKKK